MGKCFDDEALRGTPKHPTLTIYNLINGEDAEQHIAAALQIYAETQKKAASA